MITRCSRLLLRSLAAAALFAAAGCHSPAEQVLFTSAQDAERVIQLRDVRDRLDRLTEATDAVTQATAARARLMERLIQLRRVQDRIDRLGDRLAPLEDPGDAP